MRNPNRLDSFYSKLMALHKRYVPDWRFGQLMINFIAECGDPFYMEEDDFLEEFEAYLSNYS